MSNYYVDRILEEKKITDFLDENGIYPAKKTGEKWVYLCPIHAGDSSPSFVVYPVGTKGRNYQTYHCFGCHSGINIINLKSDFDKVSAKEAIRFFLKDMDVNPVEAMKSVADSIREEVSRGKKNDKKIDDGDKRIELLMLSMVNICKTHLSKIDDDEEARFFEDVFYKKVDEIARARDVETLEAFRNRLIDRQVLENRVENIRKNRVEEGVSRSQWII
jgi:hypothetical protein